MAGPLPPAGARRPRPRWLIVNGDDLGLTVGVNAGIERACRDGILRSASAMGVGAALEDAALRAGRQPSLGIGLHLTLVGERPACRAEQVPSLVAKDGLFLPNYRAFLLRYLRGGVRAGDLRRELRAQAAAVAALGAPLDHLNSHQHLHLLPGLLALTLEVAREFGIRWIRAPQPLRPSARGSQAGLDWPSRPLAERMMFAAASAWARRQIARACLPLTQGSIGFDCSGHLTSGYLLTHIPSLPAGITELICHPGEQDPETVRQYRSWGYQWLRELEALTDPGVRQELEKDGVTLANWSTVSG